MRLFFILICIFLSLPGWAQVDGLFLRAKSFNYGEFDQADLSGFRSDVKRALRAKSYGQLSIEDQKKLQELNKKLGRFAGIQKRLEDCLSKTEDRRHIIKQIIVGAGEQIASFTPCDDLYNNRVLNSSIDINNILNQEELNAPFTKLAFEQALKGSVKGLLKYEMQFSKDIYPGKEEKKNLIEDVCRSLGGCGRLRRERVVNYINSETLDIAKKIQKGELRKYSWDEAQGQLNQRVKNLNNQLFKVKNELRKKINQPSSRAQEEYELYIAKYANTASGTLGSLLFTDSLKAKIGKIVSLEDLKVSWRKNNKGEDVAVRLDYKHGYLNDEENCKGKSPIAVGSCPVRFQAKTAVGNSINEAKKRLHKHIKKISKAKNHGDLKELIKLSPVGIGKTLLSMPQMTDRICQLVMEIDASDEAEEKWANRAEATMNALDTASLALLASGAGGLVGVGTKIISAGGRVVASKMFKSSASIGMGSALASMTVSGSMAYKKSNDYESALGTLIAESESKEQIQALYKIAEERDKYYGRLLLSSTAFVPFGAAAQFSKSGRFSEIMYGSKDVKSRLRLEKNKNEVIKALSKNPNMQKKFDELIKQGKLSQEDYDLFKVTLAGDPKNINELLKKWESVEPDILVANIKDVNGTTREALNGACYRGGDNDV